MNFSSLLDSGKQDTDVKKWEKILKETGGEVQFGFKISSKSYVLKTWLPIGGLLGDDWIIGTQISSIS